MNFLVKEEHFGIGNNKRETKIKVFKDIDLILPHPRLHLRKFTLLPLVELMPDFIHPKLHKTMQALLIAIEDNSKVRKI